ncbi:MAG: type I restriction enzyme HsdR N-terminal domain-containing protein [Bacteroidales bacterium]|nr:type I restriction enzyme HsdR N-terminal domain-containing protein [Bacteroidales bacterium]
MATKVQYTDIITRECEGHREVFDPVRRRWVALTPEEWVRQCTLQRLRDEGGYPMEVMQVEGAIALNGMTRRCDIVVYQNGQPWMIVECKKSEIPLTQKVCDQACRYNTVLRVPFLLLTNGKQEVIVEVDFEKECLRQLSSLPPWGKNVKI